MTKRIMSLLMIAVILLCCGSCSGIKLTKFVDVTEETAVPPKIVFLGDSIAAGFGLEGYTASDLYNCRSYANIIGEMYDKELPEDCTGVMVNKAVSGATSSELLESIKSGELDEALAGSDAVVVSIGGNDLLSVLLGIIKDTGYNYESGKIEFSETDILSAALDLLTLDSDIDSALGSFRNNLREIAAGFGFSGYEKLRKPELLVAFCRGIQAAAPVDSFVAPEPWDMPGYDAPVIMAAGAFVQGSSIELSADGPLKDPYSVFFQGGLTWYHAKTGVLMAVQKLVDEGLPLC